ncbi:MAG: hypothetical protein ABIP94_20515 [Planctomycetota bacterium]
MRPRTIVCGLLLPAAGIAWWCLAMLPSPPRASPPQDRETIVVRGLEAVVRPVTDAHTWLLTVGWRRHGLLSVAERPA